MVYRCALPCALLIFCLTTWTYAARGEELIDIGDTNVPAGALARFPVSFYSNSIIPLTAAVSIDISYDSEHVPIPADSEGHPDCTANPAAGKTDTSFAFLPLGCSGTCAGIRATVESANDSSPIPQGVELFTCNVHPPFGTPRDGYLLILEQMTGTDPLGKPVSLSASDGFVAVYETTPGDCDGDGVVPISEVIRAVTEALGTESNECQAADLNRDGAIDVSELLTIVGTALTCDPTWPCWLHG
ncbi:MAG: hypothetical protein ABI629_02435 [bacterium]